MEQTNSFTDTLFQAVIERQMTFDTFFLPKIHEEFRIAHSATKTLRSVLTKKGIFHDESYKYDSTNLEIKLPSEEKFADSERAMVIGRRLTEFEAMLDFLNNYYSFTCDALTPERINRIITLMRTFTWDSFSNTSNKPNTRGLAELIANIRANTDPLSISILNDCLRQLSKNTISITKGLRTLAEFHRERYKVAIRKMVMPATVFNSEKICTGGMTDAIKEIKRVFASQMRDQPFYTDLIEEILREDFAPDNTILQQALLAKLSTTKTPDNKATSEENLKQALLDGVRTVGAVAPQIDEILNKIQDNYHTLQSFEKSFITKLVTLFRKTFNIPEKELEMYIFITDPATGTGKRESIIWSNFIDELRKKSRLLTGFTLRSSPTYLKIETMEEQQIFDLLSRNLAELGNLSKQLAGVDDFFKQTISSDARDRIRGIKIELSTIKNNLVKANQCRAEYSAQLEEQQQLKKLGITYV